MVGGVTCFERMIVVEKRREYEGKSRDHAHIKDGACAKGTRLIFS